MCVPKFGSGRQRLRLRPPLVARSDCEYLVDYWVLDLPVLLGKRSIVPNGHVTSGRVSSGRVHNMKTHHFAL